MFQWFSTRAGHYLLLVLTSALLALPHLGRSSLWDVDEGNNAEAAREMLESGNWIVPTFNYQLRTDKPALLYWCQIAAYRLYGVGERAARLPSALASLLAVLLTYELGRRLWSASTGLLGGLVLASSALFTAAGHFANPDALLNACTVGIFLCFWQNCTRPHWTWFTAAGMVTGLAVLAKGPVGVVLPLGVMALFLLWTWQWRQLLDWRLLLSILAFLVVAVPWYALVGAETKGEFLRGFFLRHNIGRALEPMQNHRGALYYYLVVLIVGFAPWSAFLGQTLWYGLGRRAREDSERAGEPSGVSRRVSESLHAYRLLWCWIGVYLLFFSVCATKLPNYILPIYPALALLTARTLDRWRLGTVVLPGWLVKASLASVALVGVVAAGGILVMAGAVTLPGKLGQHFPGVGVWALIGVIPVVGALAGGWFVRRRQRGAVVVCVAVAGILFVGMLAAFFGKAFDPFKAPRSLARDVQREQAEPEISIGSYHYDQPSLVFYCRREVHRFADPKEALDFLRYPVPVYLVLPAPEWSELENNLQFPCRLLGRHFDLYRHCDVVVVTNR